MGRLDRYIFRQMLGPIGGAVAALTMIALLSQSLSQFDLVIERGQGALTFLKVTLLSLPQLAGLLFPVSLFVGALVAMTRLHGDHEFVAAFSSGQSIARAAAPIVRIGVWFTLLSLFSNLYLQPLTAQIMRTELFRIKNDLVSTLIREGQFSTSESNLTIYVQRIDQNGLLRQIFIRVPGKDGHDTTYAAREGRIITKDGSSILVMRQGSLQEMSDKGTLDHISYAEYSFDITSYFTSEEYLDFKEGDRYMHELAFPNLALDVEKPRQTRFMSEANARLANPLYNLSFVMLAIVAVLGGKFSRRGYAARIAVASAVAAITRIVGVAAETASQATVYANFLQYLVPLIPIFICFSMIKKADRSTNLSRMVRPVFGGKTLTPLGGAS